MKRISWLDQNEINTSRQTELDIAKGLAVIYMVICHAVYMLSPE